MINDTADYTIAEFSELLRICRALPPAIRNKQVSVFIENLFLTVLDFQINAEAKERVLEHFYRCSNGEVVDLSGLMCLLERYRDDNNGNPALANRLWGDDLGERAAILRRLIAFFSEQGVIDQNRLEEWARVARFKSHFAGKVKGLGYGVFIGLLLRQGQQVITPEVHIRRFVAEAIGRAVDEETVVLMLERAAKELSLSLSEMNRAIWEANSQR